MCVGEGTLHGASPGPRSLGPLLDQGHLYAQHTSVPCERVCMWAGAGTLLEARPGPRSLGPLLDQGCLCAQQTGVFCVNVCWGRHTAWGKPKAKPIRVSG
eukprot:1161056-Pelagomonas_calceolata.AAC.2